MSRQPAKRVEHSAALGLLIFLAACATPREPHVPRLDRMSAEAAAASAPPAPKLGVADLEQAARAGASPEALVQRWRDDGARLPLSAADIVNLHARGVSVAHLDALLAAREQALRIDYDTRRAAEQAQAAAALAAERARVPQCPAPYPYGWGPRPYGGWGWPGGWGGGIHYGW